MENNNVNVKMMDQLDNYEEWLDSEECDEITDEMAKAYYEAMNTMVYPDSKQLQDNEAYIECEAVGQ